MNRSFFVVVVFLTPALIFGCAGSRKYQDTIADQRERIHMLEAENDRLRQEIVQLKTRTLELEVELETERVPGAHSDMEREMERLRAIIERESVEPGAKPGPELRPDVERQRSDLKEKMERDTEKLRRKLEEKAKEKSDK